MNPIILFDNFFEGYKRSYSWKTKFAIAKDCGFDGFEFVMMDFEKDWTNIEPLLEKHAFTHLGFHYSTQAVIDAQAENIDSEIALLERRIHKIAQIEGNTYMTLSLSGTDELGGETIAERGSAKAEERHWKRAAQIIEAVDRAAAQNQVKVYLYPHIDWICDTPQSLSKILSDADAQTVATSFCCHHWYANDNSCTLEESLELPKMSPLNYAVMTNAKVSPGWFSAVQIDQGEIDIARILGYLWSNGFKGPIASQGAGIPGDPYLACAAVPRYIRSLWQRFHDNPSLNPASQSSH